MPSMSTQHSAAREWRCNLNSMWSTSDTCGIDGSEKRTYYGLSPRWFKWWDEADRRFFTVTFVHAQRARLHECRTDSPQLSRWCASPAPRASRKSRPRARDLGIQPGVGATGALNAITDVTGVRVGQVTLVSGRNVRTGVTAILPHGGNLFREKVPGAVFVGNAFGKLAGSTQVQELGTIESPIVLTNTLGVGVAVDAVVRWTLTQPGNESVRSVNALVGETNDGGLNDIRSLPVTRDHVTAAITGAREGAVEEGAVGAGTGTVAFGWKGGIGTSSRRVTQGQNEWTVGVLVQSNYGGRLTIAGVPVWRELTAGRERGAHRTRTIEQRTASRKPRADDCCRRLVHDRRRDRCAARRPRSRTPRRARRLCAGANRIDVFEWQR